MQTSYGKQSKTEDDAARKERKTMPIGPSPNAHGGLRIPGRVGDFEDVKMEWGRELDWAGEAREESFMKVWAGQWLSNEDT